MGDAAALKLKITSGPEEPTVHTDKVRWLQDETFQPIDLDWLARLPHESFGFQYFDFLQKNKLKPLNFSESTKGLFRFYPVGVRYVRVHDMFHVLLGFDTSVEGELGVYAFVESQNYSKQLNAAAKTARLFGRLFFWKSTELDRAYFRGKALSEFAENFIELPFEQHFEEPVEALRRKWLPAF